MKKLFVLVFSLFSFTAFAQGDPTATPTDCTNAFFKAMLDEDGTLMGKVVAEDFSIISFNGQAVDKDLILQAVGGGYVVVETATVSSAHARTYNDNAAVVTGNWKAKGAIQGSGFDNEVVFTAVCVKAGGSWRIVNMQFTPIQP
jgi:Domain of unknown function (DUF4440)